MPRGVPEIIANYDRNRDARKELAAEQPGEQVLGHISADSPVLNPEPPSDATTWTREDGTVITLVEPPPPWEVNDNSGYHISDARRFVECPPQWRLYWINPKLLNSDGWRDWQAVMASDPRVTLRVPTMRSPEGYVRRGGDGGDILCWMWDSWYQSKRRRNTEKTQAQARDAVDKQANLADEMRRGRFGPYIRPEGVRHPTHTNADGRTMRD